MTSSESPDEPKSRSEIGAASRSPPASPAVAIAIVNQKDVRTTRRRSAGSFESK